MCADLHVHHLLGLRSPQDGLSPIWAEGGIEHQSAAVLVDWHHVSVGVERDHWRGMTHPISHGSDADTL